MSHELEFNGKNVLVVGGSSGIGNAMAIFARLFEILPMVYRNGSPSLEVAKSRSEVPSKERSAKGTKSEIQMLKNVSIRTKIISAMSVVLVVTIFLGAFSIRQMQLINARTVDIHAGWLQSVRLLGDLRAYTLTYRGLVRAHILANDAAGKVAMDKNYDLVVAGIERSQKGYEAAITSEEERALYRDFQVKALAAQTSKATDDIGAQIAGMQKATENSARTIREVGVTIRLISENLGSNCGCSRGAGRRDQGDISEHPTRRNGEQQGCPAHHSSQPRCLGNRLGLWPSVDVGTDAVSGKRPTTGRGRQVPGGSTCGLKAAAELPQLAIRREYLAQQLSKQEGVSLNVAAFADAPLVIRSSAQFCRCGARPPSFDAPQPLVQEGRCCRKPS
jgi:hypothetical protein